jgi:outer membrane lipoprotein-sorting protein
MFLASCSKPAVEENRAAPTPAGAASSSVTSPPIAEIISRYETTDTSNDSTTKLKAAVKSAGEDQARPIQLTVHRKKEPDGSQRYLVDFTAPAQERDRDAMIEVSPSGQIVVTRYTQSTGSFLTARSATDEESLFGLTLQELVGGQPEKYDYKLIGEEQYAGKPVYRVEGTLKPGAESRFARTVMLISKDNYTAPVIEAYDSQGQLARKLVVDKMEQVSGNWLRSQWSVDNQEQHKKVDFQVVDVKLNQNLPDSMFSREYLKKSASQ